MIFQFFLPPSEKVRDFWITWANFSENLIEFYQIKYGLYSYDISLRYIKFDNHWSPDAAAFSKLTNCCGNFDGYLRDNEIEFDCVVSFSNLVDCTFRYLKTFRDFLMREVMIKKEM